MAFTQTQPALLCFSYLRWSRVHERPRHLLYGAARTSRVFFIEEPAHADVPARRLDLSIEASGITVVTPVAGAGQDHSGALDTFFARYAGGKRIVWYLAPMGHGFRARLDPDLIVHDCADDEERGAAKRVREMVRRRRPAPHARTRSR